MVSLRSGRQDRTLLIVVWVLDLVVLGLGIATLQPILLLWGVIGLPGAVFLTYVHLRDTRARPPSTPPHDDDGAAPPA
ncbi:hypothetical protein [Frankia sp. AgB32]|uniref:hypothetical protein n=1 Tax=Frankia sp. AgB32 TaxID=631119 RepID=UPI00200C5B05|nr:hypothetical protein [Frankia sp. AgB32]MCK9894693.1 hypothetical protein [Frankia sp. AgB32]